MEAEDKLAHQRLRVLQLAETLGSMTKRASSMGCPQPVL